MSDWSSGLRRPRWEAFVVGVPVAIAAQVLIAWLASRAPVNGPLGLEVWFPATGFMLVLLVTYGARFAPAAVVAQGLALRATGSFSVRGATFPQMAVDAAVTSLPYAAAATVLRRTLRSDPLVKAGRTVLLVMVVGVLGATSIAAIGDSLCSTWMGALPRSEVVAAARVWWLAGAIGVLGLGLPLLVLIGWAAGRPRAAILRGFQSQVWAIFEAAALVITPPVAFWSGSPNGNRYFSIVFLPVVVLALHRGLSGAAIASLATIVGCVVVADVSGHSTVGRSDLQSLLVVLGVTSLVIGAVVSDRIEADRQRRVLSRIVDATTDVVAIANPSGDLTYLNQAGRDLLGVEGDPVLRERPTRLFELYGNVDGQRRMEVAVETALRMGPIRSEAVLRGADGRDLQVSQVVIAEANPDGELVRFSVIARDLTAQREVENELARRVLFDPLTGILLREPFEQRITAALASTPRYRPRVALLVVDLERFRLVNDTLGHKAADEVLVTAVGRARSWLPPGAVLGRIAGAQLGVLLPDVADRGTAIVAAEALVQAMEGPTQVDDGRAVRLAAAVGVTMAQSADADPKTLLRRASLAAVEAREGGESRVAAFDDDLATRAQRRVALEADLREAIGGDDWRLFYQPVVDADTRTLVSAEALLRWTHPLLGPLPAFEVARLAEETGLIVPLGRAILRRACADAAEWNKGSDRPVSVGVNVSVRQLLDLDFEDDVVAALTAAGLEAEQLSLEVTETALIEDPAAVTTRLRRLKALGLTVALDDFGTGYSSLAALRDLPIDVLKLDASFLLGLERGGRAATFTAAVLAMANALGLIVIAEGVEDDRQAMLLRDLGCHRLQGYLVGRPAPADKLAVSRPAITLDPQQR